MWDANIIVKHVMKSVLDVYPEQMEELAETQQSIDEAVSSLAPFEPSAIDQVALNQALLNYRASDLACKAAWALYKDMVQNSRQAA